MDPRAAANAVKAAGGALGLETGVKVLLSRAVTVERDVEKMTAKVYRRRLVRGHLYACLDSPVSSMNLSNIFFTRSVAGPGSPSTPFSVTLIRFITKITPNSFL